MVTDSISKQLHAVIKDVDQFISALDAGIKQSVDLRDYEEVERLSKLVQQLCSFRDDVQGLQARWDRDFGENIRDRNNHSNSGNKNQRTNIDSSIDKQLQLAGSSKIPTNEKKNGDSDEEQRRNFHDQCVSRLGQHFRTKLIKVNQTIYKSQNNNAMISCSTSRKYPDEKYWFGFTEKQFKRLKAAQDAFATFGCGNRNTIFVFPLSDIEKWLPGLNQTINDQQHYWHIHITRQSGRWTLLRKGDFDNIDIEKYCL